MVANRHHYVPKLLLKRFSIDPKTENPPLWRLDKQSGRSFLTSVANEAVIKHYNRLEGVCSLQPNYVEELLARIEGDAGTVIAKLLSGLDITAAERLQLALFMWMQQQRTPQGREWVAFSLEQSERLLALQKLSDERDVRGVLKGSRDFQTDEQIEEWRKKTISQLEDGSLFFGATHDHEVLGMFVAAEQGSIAVANRMSWVGLRATGGSQFIISDHPLAIYDQQALPDIPVGWLSSPTVQVTLPLAPSFCLLLRPGHPSYETAEAEPAHVQELNLRTFAWGHWAIYGPTAAAVQQVRAAAKRHPSQVGRFAPRAPTFTVLERHKGDEHHFKSTIYRPPARGGRSRRSK